MKRLIAAALFTAPLLAAPLHALASPVNLVANGGFDTPAVAPGTWTIVNSFAGWTVGPNGLELRNNVAGSAFAGTGFAELDTTANSWISQALNTVAGQSYSLSFAYANRPDQRGAASNGLAWSIGSLTGTVGNNTDTSWATFTTTFVGTGSPMTLRFAATGTSDGYGTSLDNIIVNTINAGNNASAVPEPQSLALMLAGLGVMGVVVRRRRGAGKA